MHTYRNEDDDGINWTVGFYTVWHKKNELHRRWHPLKCFNNEDAAAAYASYLNGGPKP